jgi:hypothetical protein
MSLFKDISELFAPTIDGLGNEAIVKAAYQDLLGYSDADTMDNAQARIDYWVGELNSGLSTANFGEQFLSEAETSQGSLITATTFENNKTVVQAHRDEIEANPDATIAELKTVASTNRVDDVDSESDSGTSGETFTLTTSTDKATSEKFEAPQDYTPGGNDRVNTLQDEDELTGSGDSASLDATLGNAGDNGATTITPTLTDIKTVDAAFSGSDTQEAVDQLDLQDTSGIETLNVTRVSDGINTELTLDNVKATTTALSVSNSEQPTQSIDFAYDRGELSASDDAATVTLNEVEVTNLEIDERGTTAEEGFETISMTVDGLSLLDQLEAEDLQTLNIDGAADLTIGGTVAVNEAGTTNKEVTGFSAGMAAVAGSLTTVDASELTGGLTYHVGDEIDATQEGTTSGVVNMAITGGSGDDKFVLTNGANVGGTDANTDVIDGGEGTDTLTINGTATVAAADEANLRSIDNVEVRSGHDDDNVADAIDLDFDAFDANVADVFVRNEGHDTDDESEAEDMTVNLNDMSETEADNIRIGHSNTTNSGISNNDVNVTFKTDAADNSAAVTIVDDFGNQDPVFNFQLDVADGEQVTLADKDSESNSIDLTASASQANSSLTVTDGTAGEYLNLDVDPDAADADEDAGDHTGYGTATDGNTGDATSAAAAGDRDTDVGRVFKGAGDDDVTRHDFETVAAGDFAGDLEMRLDEIERADGVTSMDITTGSGDDTLIFDAQDVDTAGFTSADTVAMGTGTDTMVIDGDTSGENNPSRIDHQASEWDNVSGVDVLRYGSNDGVNHSDDIAYDAGAYFARIDNEFIEQTDDGSRLTVVNNDGLITEENESDLVLDMQGLDQDNHVTFVGADGDGANANLNSNRLVVDDVSMNEGMEFDGGDSDTTAGQVGNNNVLEIRDTANVSVDDLSNVSNFDNIELTSSSNALQTFTLTINDTVFEALADSTNSSSNNAETVAISVHDVDGSGADAEGEIVLNAGSVTGNKAFDVDADNDDAYADEITTGAGDDNIDTKDGDDTIDAGAGEDTITGGAGDDTITGGAGADTLDGGDGDDTFVFNAGDGEDTINNFVVGDDDFDIDNTDGNLVEDGTGDGTVDIDTVNVIDTAADITVANGIQIVDNGDGDIADADGLTTANIADRLNDTGDDNNGGGGDNIISFANADDEILFAISDGTDTAIVEADAGAGDTVIEQGELTVLITLDGIGDAGTLSAANFDGFA